MSKLWLVKDKKGRIFGPYNEQEICFYIEEGEFKGEELLSSYPSGNWKPLSTHSVFYEKILAKLNEKAASAPSSDSSVSVEESSIDSENIEKEPIEPTQIVTPKEDSSSKTRKKVRIKLSKEFKEGVLEEEGESDIIEMEDFKERFFKRLKTSLKIPFLLFVFLSVFVFVFIFLVPDTKNINEERVRLLSVSKTRKPWSSKELNRKIQTALFSYYKGTVSDYLDAQSQYVQILEAYPDRLDIYHYLCLVYLELWPFAYQDARDKNTLNRTLNLVRKKDKGRIYSDLCKSVQALINKNHEKSLTITNNALNEISKFSPVFFYYIKAKALKALNRNVEAKGYLKSIYKLKSEWIAPYMLEAQMFYEKKQYDLAAKFYRKILSIFPEHTSAGLRMGILEYKYFKKPQRSQTRLKSILLNLNDLVEPNILMEAYIILANIYFKQNDQQKALEYSHRAYALDPEHPDVIMLRLKLGGEKDNLKGTKMKAWGLIYKGDILVGQGKCSEAQSYFKKAYTADDKKNALAALRMAQCYWQSRASGQAIRWLRRSINADSRMLEAYFLLSEYLSELYDFESATEVLRAVKNQRPSNYDLFKAYAFLSFRQEKYNATVAYAQRSLEFYASDTEIYILLSKAYRALGKGHKAYVYADKAIQEDNNNIQAQISYALSLELAYNYKKAEDYFKKLINRFPLIMEYSQALGEFYFNRGMHEKALARFNSIIGQDSKFKPAYIFLGRIYNYLSLKEGGRGKKYEQAIRYFVEASLLDISDPEPLFFSGKTHMGHEQYQFAENEFNKILQINPNYPMIHYHIALVNFYQQGEENLEKALKFARTQSAKTPDNFKPYKLIGDIYKLRSKGVFEDSQRKRVTYELCAKEYQKALKYLNTVHEEALETSIGLIECYKGAGNLDSALQLSLQLIKTEGLSGYPDFYKEIGSIFEAKSQYEEARSYYTSYFSLRPGAKDRVEIENRINKLIDDKQKISQPEE